jgi:hypothetical protein
LIEYTDYQYLNFKDATKSGDLTRLWLVYSKTRSELMGTVGFKSAINKYVFAPSTANQMTLDAGELDEIRSFLVTQTTLWMK